MHKIVQRNRLVQKIRDQNDLLLSLQEQLDTYMFRSFPSLGWITWTHMFRSLQSLGWITFSELYLLKHQAEEVYMFRSFPWLFAFFSKTSKHLFCMYILMKRNMSAKLLLLCQICGFMCNYKSINKQRLKTILNIRTIISRTVWTPNSVEYPL